MNVKELRKRLDRLEETCDELWIKHAGPFELTEILVPHYESGKFVGYGPVRLINEPTLGIVFEQEEEP